VEGVLLEAGRHLFLVPDLPPDRLRRALIAWNESREAARAVHEALPYLLEVEATDVVVVDDDRIPDVDPAPGAELVKHLRHCGVEATLETVKRGKDGVSATLLSEAERRQADLIVMGGYSRSRLREKVFGGPTYDLLHTSPVPLIIAH
jgi:nucleotide-binding universal stress UspA family protein